MTTRINDALTQIAFRIPTSMLAKIDQYAALMRDQSPGLGATRTDALRVLIAKAIAAHEAEHGVLETKKRK